MKLPQDGFLNGGYQFIEDSLSDTCIINGSKVIVYFPEDICRSMQKVFNELGYIDTSVSSNFNNQENFYLQNISWNNPEIPVNPEQNKNIYLINVSGIFKVIPNNTISVNDKTFTRETNYKQYKYKSDNIDGSILSRKILFYYRC